MAMKVENVTLDELVSRCKTPNDVAGLCKRA